MTRVTANDLKQSFKRKWLTLVVECDSGYIRCDGRCIPGYQICDGVTQCSNGEDERNCCK